MANSSMYIPIRLKLALLPTILILLTATFIYFYFPAQYQSQALEANKTKVRNLAELFSLSIGIALNSSDFIGITEVYDWAKRDSLVELVAVYDTDYEQVAEYAPNGNDYTIQELLSGRGFSEKNSLLFYTAPIHFQQEELGYLVVGYSQNSVYLKVAQQRTWTLFISAMILIFGVLLSFVFSKQITQPITRLRDITRSVVMGEEIKLPEFLIRDEVGELGQDFKRMVHRLRETNSDLEEFSKQLQKSNQELNQFAYVTSHDLKAPLRAISNLSSFLEQDTEGQISDESRGMFVTMRERVVRMERLIEAILEFSRVGRQDTKMMEVDMNTVAKEVVEVLNPLGDYEINVPSNLPVIRMNEVRAQQLLQNLISNSIKHCDKAKVEIDITYELVDENHQFSVTDNGPGIDPKYHEKVFVMFQTLQERDAAENTGVGLTIVKKILEEVGGSIWLDSTYHRGARFIFQLPV